MEKNNTQRNPRPKLSIFSFLVAGMSFLFFAPFAFPVRDGLSFSYILGFNNKVAVLVFLLFALSFGLWSRGLGFSLPDRAKTFGACLPKTALIAVACITLLGCLIVWFFNKSFVVVGEAHYFLDRLEMFKINGQPFRDFSFDYGPIMLFLPVWIARLSHASLANSYFIAWTIQWMVGTWFLWKLVDIASRGTRGGRIIFLLFWMYWLSALIDSGTNYTPLRYCSGLLAAVAIQGLYASGIRLRWILGALAATMAILGVYSPEQGISFFTGTLLFFFVCVRRKRPGTLPMLMFFTVIACLGLILAFRLHLLDSILNFGGGVLDFPLLPSFQTIVLVTLLVLAGCVMVSAFRGHRSEHPLLYLICVSLGSLPAAFGRADIGHIIINCLGALLATLVVLSQYPQLWRWTWPAFAIVISLFWVSHFTQYRPYLRKGLANAALQDRPTTVATLSLRLLRLLGGRDAQANMAEIRAWKILVSDRKLPLLPNRTFLLAPFGFERRMSLIDGDPQISTGRYFGLFPLIGTFQIQDKIAELEDHPDIPLITGVQISWGGWESALKRKG